MDQPTKELKVPAAIYERAEEIAGETNRTAESVLLESLAILFSPDTGGMEEPDALSCFNDDQLWMTVLQRLTPKQDARLRELADRGNRGVLREREATELEAWVARVDRQMLLRSRALLLLKRRGHDINHYLENHGALDGSYIESLA